MGRRELLAGSRGGHWQYSWLEGPVGRAQNWMGQLVIWLKHVLAASSAGLDNAVQLAALMIHTAL